MWDYLPTSHICMSVKPLFLRPLSEKKKKSVRKLNATRLSLLPYYPTAISIENGRCHGHQRKYKTQQKTHLTCMQQQPPEPQTITKIREA